jgi:SAM-dependent methyltransferase
MPVMTAAARLGHAVRRVAREPSPGGALVLLAAGQPAPRSDVEATLGPAVVADLVSAGVLRQQADDVTLGFALGLSGDLVFVAPDRDETDDSAAGPEPERIYLGPDSPFLVDAVVRLAPRGRRAVDLGSGTGLLAAVLSPRYDTVVATDVAHRVAAASGLTLALNERAPGHVAGAIVADVAAGLRPGAFDLVTANTPWVPAAPDRGAARRVFADGGSLGIELPSRFLAEGAELLAPGGVAIMLALDMTCDDGSRPLRHRCSELDRAGFTTVVVPTPLNWLAVGFAGRMRSRQPRLTDAVHVAVVVAAPIEGGGRRDAIVLAAEALARRWTRWQGPAASSVDRVSTRNHALAASSTTGHTEPSGGHGHGH